ncbi:MAG: hypothetical protein ACE5HJ_01620 [Thermoplasmata archaeon]
MLTIQEDETAEELRRELIVLLHVSREDYARFPPVKMLRDALSALKDLRSALQVVSSEHAALKISVPPFLLRERLRGTLSGCLKQAFGHDVALSIRLPGELADTVEASREILEEMTGEGAAILCFTDEEAVGEPTIHLYDLKEYLGQRISEALTMAFPINHYDVLCVWEGEGDGVVWGPDRQISAAYEELVKVAVSSTARRVEAVEDLLGLSGM